MIVRELIKELLEFNLDATVNIRDMYGESESIHFSWIDNNENTDIGDSKKGTPHLFLEIDDIDCESRQEGVM